VIVNAAPCAAAGVDISLGLLRLAAGQTSLKAFSSMAFRQAFGI